MGVLLTLAALHARTGVVSPRVANPDVTRSPRPVRPLFGFGHWTLLVQILVLLGCLAIAVALVVKWRRDPGSPVVLMAIATTLLAWQDPIMNWASFAVYSVSVALARGLAPVLVVANDRTVHRRDLPASIAVGASPVQADPGDGIALNGTYTAFFDGVWAKTNDSYHDERSVTQTWTITSTCSTYQDCNGRVTSDQGWSGELVYMSGSWILRRTVDNWEPCIDGTATPGEPVFTFSKGYQDPLPVEGLGYDEGA